MSFSRQMDAPDTGDTAARAHASIVVTRTVTVPRRNFAKGGSKLVNFAPVEFVLESRLINLNLKPSRRHCRD